MTIKHNLTYLNETKINNRNMFIYLNNFIQFSNFFDITPKIRN